MLKSFKTKGQLTTRGGRKKASERPLAADAEPDAEASERPLVRADVPPAEHGDAPDAPAAVPPPVRGPRLGQARPGVRVVEVLGLATLSEVTASGRVVGYGITCNRHHNARDKHNTKCKKQCILGTGPLALSHHEAKLRLKRWFLAGQTLEDGWSDALKREHHLKCGGPGLAWLASDQPGWDNMTEEELNEACMRIAV